MKRRARSDQLYSNTSGRDCVLAHSPKCPVCLDVVQCGPRTTETCPHGIEISPNLLRRSAENGDCQICHVFWYALQSFPPLFKPNLSQSYSVVVNEGLVSAEGWHLLLIKKNDANDSKETRILANNYESQNWFLKSKIYGVELSLKEANKYWLGTLLSRNVAIERSPGSQISQLRVAGWLTECLRSHQKCGSLVAWQSTRTPSRLVCITSPSTAYLTTSHEANSSYVALSYCWGSSRFLKTTKNNFQAHLEDIPWSQMPKTFQQAISLTVTLGYNHIWIDALCVIQESPLDFATQSAMMGDIFARAVVVIAADSGSSADEGFMAPREYASTEITIPSSKRSAVEPGQVFTFPHTYSSLTNERVHTHQAFASDPAFGRAWCFQEHKLATRILHVTSSEFYWECASRSLCECGLRQLYDHESETTPLSRWQLAVKQYQGGFLGPRSASRYWWSLVEKLSTCKLTHVEDRLPAISGLAQRMQDDDLGAYIAGLWEKELPLALLWRSSSGNNWRPTAYIGPSWSWVSVMGAIVAPRGTPDQYDLIAQVNRVKYMLGDADPYGVAQSAFLTLTAPTLSCKFELLQFEGKFFGDIAESCLPQAIIEGAKEVLCVLIGHVNPGSYRGQFAEALVLCESSREENVHERVGVLLITQEKSVLWEEKTTVII